MAFKGLVGQSREALRSSLYNWKFNTASRYLDGSERPEVKRMVRVLAKEFGNVGWIEGNMGKVINAVVTLLIGDGE